MIVNGQHTRTRAQLWAVAAVLAIASQVLSFSLGVWVGGR